MAGASEARAAAVDVERALAVMTARLGRPGLRSGAAVIADLADRELHELEAPAVMHASAARRAEFTAGRALLRRLLGDQVVVPPATNRRPILPAGSAASLAHDAELVVAVASPAGDVALGVDVERAGAVDVEAASVVVRPDEVGLDPTVLFCAKEAVYKAWSSAGGGFLEHHDVSVRLDGAIFTAAIDRSGRPAAPAVTEPPVMVGSWAVAGGRVLAVVAADLSPTVAPGRGR